MSTKKWCSDGMTGMTPVLGRSEWNGEKRPLVAYDCKLWTTSKRIKTKKEKEKIKKCEKIT